MLYGEVHYFLLSTRVRFVVSLCLCAIEGLMCNACMGSKDGF